MDKNQFTQLLKEKPYLKRMGKGLLSKRYNISPEDIVSAKKSMYSQYLPKVLILDIETAPMKAFIWKRWKENISLDQTISEWFMLAWSAKWLYSSEIFGEVLTPKEVLQEDDSRICMKLWDLLNQATIVITHNGDKFDLPRINSRFIINSLDPPTPYFSIDTCKIAKKQFGFSSNKLDALAGYFDLPHKLETGFELWKNCMNGDQESLQYMLTYNKMDVAILEEIYLILRPWIKNHPNIGNLSSTAAVCASCGSVDVEEIEGEYYYTNVRKYKLFRCKHCGAISRARLGEKKSLKFTNIGK